MPPADKRSSQRFTPYQTFVVAALAFLQFAVILDFMIVAPLGALVMPALDMSPRQFGLIVSAYAFSAGASGLLVAGFADRYDRKKLLLFFYTGFVLGTLWGGVANSFHALLAARIVTGIFGGVIGSVVLAIATDLFEPGHRGRVMGFIQTSFAASQILGLPVGIYLSNHWSWHAPFLVMVVFGVVGGLVDEIEKLHPDTVAFLQRAAVAGVPLVGFTWYSLTDQIDWSIAMSQSVGLVYPVGLFDLNRESRIVGLAYKHLIDTYRDLPDYRECKALKDIMQ